MRKIIIVVSFSILTTSNGYAQHLSPDSNKYQMSPIHMPSRWAKDVDPDNSLKEYPRPQLQRNNWINLNGLWEYTILDSSISAPPKYFEGSILVPYPIESALSGVKKTLMPDKSLWYRKIIKMPTIIPNDRVLLNFGAIDWKSIVFINNKQVGQHTGGYLNFTFDITNFLVPGNNEILVKVYDPTDQGPNPHGKQTLNPANIYYTASSGIWQTVWIETVPSAYISRLKTTPDIDRGSLQINVTTKGKMGNMMLEVAASAAGKKITKIKVPIKSNQTIDTINIPNARLWSPDDPFLYDLSIKLVDGNKTIDEINSYFGMRKINIQKDERGTDRIFLNNKYTFNLGTLDQGFWPEGLYTAPTDEALAFDIKTIKSLGFNTIRKHIKIEPERWYYHADRIGILVWQDFVNPPQMLPEGSKPIFEKETQETIEQLYNHPSIITWVLFNEHWGAYDQERLTSWIKKYDPSRIVNGHSGELLYVNNQLREPATSPWIGSDLTDVHSYPNPRMAPALPNKARVVGEFGGVGVSVPGHEWDDTQGWGYIQTLPSELKGQYMQMIQELKKLEVLGISASIYTQPFDVEGEENGLLTYDRAIIKIPVHELRTLNQDLVSQTKGFTLDSNFVIASDIDIYDNDGKYEDLMKEYKEGKRDSVNLRRLILISKRKNDQDGTTEIGNDYIKVLINPFSKENLTFIQKITTTSKDKGFEIFWKQSEKVDQVLGENSALSTVKAIIEAEEIKPFIQTNPNWEAIERTVIRKYGDVGAEVVYGRKMLYYAIEANPRDWEKYAKYYVLYFKKAIDHPIYHVNNMSWYIFQHVNDKSILEFAVEVMNNGLRKWDKNNSEAYDTYANLLHKLNKTNEAIRWEEKAVKMRKGAPDEKLFAETLQKMKAGLPTWPQNTK